MGIRYFNDFTLPIKIDNDCDYFFKLKEILENYIKRLNEITLDSDVIKQTQNNCDIIINSIIKYCNADIMGAQNDILNLIKQFIDNEFIVSNINDSYAYKGLYVYTDTNKVNEITAEVVKSIKNDEVEFYKARKDTYGKLFTRENMLHIPFDMREKISTQRFSIAGIPCMYLGTSSYVCWLELDEPDYEEFYVSAYKMPSNLKILNLAIDSKLIDVLMTDKELISKLSIKDAQNLYIKLITLWPLICATSFTVSKQSNRSFKSEYIISQLTMSVLKQLDINGVAYYSKKLTSDEYSSPASVNLAILAHNNITTSTTLRTMNKYSDFTKQLELTEPINFHDGNDIELYERLGCGNFIDRNFISPQIEINGKYISYKHSDFRKIDSYLIKQRYQKP